MSLDIFLSALNLGTLFLNSEMKNYFDPEKNLLISRSFVKTTQAREVL
jgi:hypothetical protein